MSALEAKDEAPLQNKSEKSLQKLIFGIYKTGKCKNIGKWSKKKLVDVILDYTQCVDKEMNPLLFCSTFCQNGHKNLRECDRSECIVYIQEQIIQPLLFYMAQFKLPVSDSDHMQRFRDGPFTAPLKWSNHSRFWSANGNVTLPSDFQRHRQTLESQCLMSVCHLIQKESGTAVHIGNGQILTCAHCIAVDDVDQPDANKIGLTKYVIFANKEIVVCQVVNINEASHVDLALLQIVDHCNPDLKQEEFINTLGVVKFSDTAAEDGICIFTIGAPWRYDIESKQKYKTDFNPKIFHPSFGYLIKAKTRSFTHCCWTYWGHSGAPIFDLQGHFIGMHESVDFRTAVRSAISVTAIHEFLEQSFPQSTK